MNLNRNITESATNNLWSKHPSIEAALKLVDGSAREDLWENVHITFERADANLLSTSADLCSGKSASLTSDKKYLLGWKHEIIVAVDSEHNILGHIGALLPDEKLRDTTKVKHLVFRHRDKLAYLLRISVTGWCLRLEEWQESPLGELQTRDILVTIFQAPRHGNFDFILNHVATEESMRLHCKNTTFGMHDGSNPDVLHFAGELSAPVAEFETAVFFDGLKDCLPPDKTCGKANLGDIHLDFTTWEDGNKVRLRLEREGVKLGFFYAGDPKGMLHTGKQHVCVDSIDATLAEAKALLVEVKSLWEAGQRPQPIAK